MDRKCACIASLADMMDQAIKSGDWKVDGACDPDFIINQAARLLRENGWTQNSIDGYWQDVGWMARGIQISEGG